LQHTGSWDADFSTDQAEVTAEGDGQKTYVAGFADFKLSYSGYVTDTASTSLVEAALDGVARKFYAYPFASDSIYFFGTGFFSWQQSHPVDGASTFSGEATAATAVGRVGF
jgi:hypothetical protein